MPHIDRRLAAMQNALKEDADFIAVVMEERNRLKEENRVLKELLEHLEKELAA